jgi:hypothetical protein
MGEVPWLRIVPCGWIAGTVWTQLSVLMFSRPRSPSQGVPSG